MATTKNPMTKEKFDIYKDVTRKIVMRLAEGDIPWHKRWCTPLQEKINYKSRRKYSGVNLLILQDEGEYMTFKQCEEAGGTVKKGEHGHTIYQYFPIPKKEDKEEYERLKKAGENTDHIRMNWILKQANVFHLSQIDGINSKTKSNAHESAQAPVDMANFIISEFSSNTGISVDENRGDSCFLNESDNKICIPLRTQFKNEEQWYSTLFSELAKTVITRNLDSVNDEKETETEEEDKTKKVSTVQFELESEIAACMVMSSVGLTIKQTEEDTMAECSKWMAEMNKNYRLIVNASSKAQKIAEYILKPIM